MMKNFMLNIIFAPVFAFRNLMNAKFFQQKKKTRSTMHKTSSAYTKVKVCRRCVILVLQETLLYGKFACYFMRVGEKNKFIFDISIRKLN